MQNCAQIKIPLLLLLEQIQIVTVLIVVVIFFGILLILGVRKSYKLKKENEKLDEISEKLAKEEKKYTDFTDGHMYQ
ncbi:hypothetical protein KO566_11930 [Flavobacteriaceae bacterium XHP0103]|uniref:hypothetical protein n=1 Tax=Marixanthotalea marina TaxID=2844359 RepID=UPI002989A916|nr:hypothetical protein [Marixanthotalea marina]MBU3822772.1 hypothetical protein [Marixanthotalea marina]